MYAAERQEQILARARTLGRVEVATLAKELGVTPETIRRDLSALEKAGALRRAHGGAIPVERLASFEPEISSRKAIMAAEKARIAKAALDEIPDRGTIFIEAGSTPGALAELLPDRPLTVVTTGLSVATTLTKRPRLTVLMVGGRIRGRTLAAVDDWAIRDLSSVRVDVAFLGTNGFSAEDGLTTPDVAEAAIKRAALSIGRRTILLADHTKFGAASLCRYGSLSDLDLLITDELPKHAADSLPDLEVRQT